MLSSSEFRLQAVVEAAIDIAGLHAAQKRLQVAYHIDDATGEGVVGVGVRGWGGGGGRGGGG